MFSAAHSHVNDPSIQEILHQKDQRITVLEGELFVMKEQLAWLKKQIFGTKSERLVADLSTQPLLPELDLSCQDLKAEPEKEEVTYKRNKPSKNRGSDKISFPDDLPVKQIVLDLPAKEKVCPETGLPLVRIGEEVSRKLARTAEQFLIIEYIRPKYASKAFPALCICGFTTASTRRRRCSPGISRSCRYLMKPQLKSRCRMKPSGWKS